MIFNYPMNLLKYYDKNIKFMDERFADEKRQKMAATLNEFKIDAVVLEKCHITPIALTFEIQPALGVSVKNINRLKADIELRLKASIEIIGNAAGKDTIAVAVKNSERPVIGLRKLLEAEQFKKSSVLTIAVGMDIFGEVVYKNLTEMPHLLIAGTTGAGKSVFIDDILLSILSKANPEEVKLLLIDPKLVELMPYNGIPHLIAPVISDADNTLEWFLWLEDEMQTRYQKFADKHVKNIEDYNSIAEKKYAKIVIVIDEYSDLMADSPKELNQVVDRIARLGRAAGVHLILATQLPVASIVTPQIKANIPCRASFTVIDSRESHAILDRTGAERLLGSGDMIFSPGDNSQQRHVQAAFVSEDEVHNIIEYIKSREEY